MNHNPLQLKFAFALWTLPLIREPARRENAVIYFGDEAGVRSDFHAGTTGAPKGRTPIGRAAGKRFALNRISAVSAQGEMRFMTVEGRVTADVFIEFLRRLLHGAQRPVYLIVDGHPAHRAAQVRRFVEGVQGRLRLYWLPPYSLELNPDELVWNQLKHHRLSRFVFSTREELKGLAVSLLHTMQKLPQLIQSFFCHSELNYITM